MTILTIHWFPFGSSVCYIITFLHPVYIFTSSSTWILGCLVSIPDVLLVKYEIPPGDKHPQCYKETKGMKGSLEVLYDLSVLTIQYIGPVLIMVYSYGMIAHTIWRKTDISISPAYFAQALLIVQMLTSLWEGIIKD